MDRKTICWVMAAVGVSALVYIASITYPTDIPIAGHTKQDSAPGIPPLVHGQPATTDQTPAPGDVTAATTQAPTPGDVTAATTTHPLHPASFRLNHRFTLSQLINYPEFYRGVELTAEELAAYNELHVVPFDNAAVYSKYCEPYPQIENAQECTYERVSEAHPYYAIDDAELAEMAEVDPLAAAIIVDVSLSDRQLPSEQIFAEEVPLTLRAAALSGKPGPIWKLAQRRFSGYESTSLFETTRNSSIVANRLALEIVLDHMGDPRANQRRWLDIAESFDQTPEIMADAKSSAEDMLNYMAEIERNITGSNKMEGYFDE